MLSAKSDAKGEVSFSVEGSSTLLAVDNSDQYTNEVFNTGHIALNEGECLAILRSKAKPGKVTLKAECKELKAATVKFRTIEN